MILSAMAKVVKACMEIECKQATVYLSTDLIVRATVRCKSKSSTELVVTVGKPNYMERLFIKACKSAGEPFPVRKVQLRPWPKRKGKK